MPDEALNQGQTIDDLILDILADEAQIIRCLRAFFCKTLQEISCEKYMTPERKVKLASDMINAAAKKEEALAAVLEAISLFEVEPDEWIPIAPGGSYPLPAIPPLINHVMCEARTDSGMTSTLAIGSNAMFPDYSLNDINEIPVLFEYTGSAFSSTEKMLFNTGNATIYIRNLTTALIP